jgi:SAM-dependent methyltransferase
VEHLQDQFHFVRECRRVLKPGGRLVLSTPNILNLASRLKYLLTGFYSLVPRPINEFSLVPVFDQINPTTYYQLRYMLHTQGFTIEQVTTDLYRRGAAFLYFLKPLVHLYSVRTMRKGQARELSPPHAVPAARLRQTAALSSADWAVRAPAMDSTVPEHADGPRHRPAEPVSISLDEASTLKGSDHLVDRRGRN